MTNGSSRCAAGIKIVPTTEEARKHVEQKLLEDIWTVESLPSFGFTFSEVSIEQSWDLLASCRSCGAQEFTLKANVQGAAGTLLSFFSPDGYRYARPKMRNFFAALVPYSLPAGRRFLAHNWGDSEHVPLWKLTLETEAILKRAFELGFVDSGFDENLWLEDLTVYRDGEFMMGVITHEGLGFLKFGNSTLKRCVRGVFQCDS